METPEDRQRIRESPEYELQFRRPVLERDEGSCRICGINKESHVHHIKSFYSFHSLRLDPENGIVLCKRCHLIAHGIEYDGDLMPPYDWVPSAYDEGYYNGLVTALEDRNKAIRMIVFEDKCRARQAKLIART